MFVQSAIQIEKEGIMANFVKIAPTLVLNLDKITVIQVLEPVDQSASPKVLIWWVGENEASIYIGSDARKLADWVSRQRDIDEI